MKVWKDKEGKEVHTKEFLIRWKEGIEGITPLQKERTNLWSMLPVFGGIFWGLAVTWIGGTWWLTLVLCGSLPIVSISFISTLQKY
jgi:hypothetical protein